MVRYPLGEETCYVVRALKERNLADAPKDNFVAVSPTLRYMTDVNRWISKMAAKYPQAKHFRVVDCVSGVQTWRKRPQQRTLARFQNK